MIIPKITDKSSSDFKWQCGPSLAKLKDLPTLKMNFEELLENFGKKNDEDDDVKTVPPTAQGKAFLNSVDQKIIDFEQFYKMDMAGKGTGYDAYGEAIENARDLK